MLASGKLSNFKIECDALTANDWHCLAYEICKRAGHFDEVVGVPRGGLALAEAIDKINKDFWKPEGSRRLVVDDVLTTGSSISGLMDRRDDTGWVVFARGPVPYRVRALFQMAPEVEL